MAETLTISELIERVDDFVDDERTPFAEEPWTAASQVIWNDGDRTDPIVLNGKVFGYFLEPSVIAEVKSWLEDEPKYAQVERVIQYAIYDA